LGARIISVVESFDAMSRSRPYRAALSPVQAVLELRRCSSTQFDQHVVAVFEEVYDKNFAELNQPPADEP
jgi:HD-GYP domain-containing protein (c-di-GMP phosphodiesterase class II)